mgnify:FL=1
MNKRLLMGAGALIFVSGQAVAQSAPTEQQMQQAQTAMFQAEAQFFSLAAQRLQKQLSDAQAELDYWRKYNAPVSPHAANEGKAR